MKISLLTNEIEGLALQTNFRRIEEGLSREVITNGSWTLFSLTFPVDVSKMKIAHNLNFTPLDLLVTRSTGSGILTVEYALFDATNLVFSVSGTSSTNPLVVRALVGRL